MLTQAAQSGAGPDWLCSRLAGLTGRWVQAAFQGANSLEQQAVASVLGESSHPSWAEHSHAIQGATDLVKLTIVLCHLMQITAS